MIWEHLDKKLIKLHQEASSPGEVFEKLGECFIEEGYTKEDYVDALKEREAQFPTGLDINVCSARNRRDYDTKRTCKIYTNGK